MPVMIVQLATCAAKPTARSGSMTEREQRHAVAERKRRGDQGSFDEAGKREPGQRRGLVAGNQRV